ncbi:hypothetical protein [Archangium sp.]|jgi:hypothetical protein|uniref:hypothetical protein n=1 Tax=Archangium sp. TaxID=1872627 RepID=UPI002ED91915
MLRMAVGALVLCIGSGCVQTRARIPDAPKPTGPITRSVDFRPLFEQNVQSYSVFLERDPNSMRRVLLGPNLVFEPSRSSLAEPRTVGPAIGPNAGDVPQQGDALGEPISIKLSSMLLDFLGKRKSTVIAPVVTRRWWGALGPVDARDQATWVERLMLLSKKLSKEELNGEELPTAALAVRQFGVSSSRLSVVAVRNPTTGELEYRQRRSPDEASVCPAAEFSLPAIFFSAEVVSIRDGRIIARIHERRTPKITQELRRSVPAAELIPVRKTEQTSFMRGAPAGEPYSYIERWDQKSRECESAQAAYEQVLQLVAIELVENLDATAAELLQSSLGRLYQ